MISTCHEEGRRVFGNMLGCLGTHKMLEEETPASFSPAAGVGPTLAIPPNVELLRVLIWKSFGCASHDLEFSVGTGGWLTILALLLIFNQHSLVHH